MQHRAKPPPGSALIPALVAGLTLSGCPQMLDDRFGDPSGFGPDSAQLAGAGGTGSDFPAAGAAGTEPDPRDASALDAPDTPRTELGELLVHRYRFDRSDSSVVDSIGDADGVTMGAVQSNGRVTLTGSNYVELPNGIVSSLASVTLEAWVTWSADPFSAASDWQILFSFGTNANGEGRQGSGTTYLALTPKASDSGDIRASYTLTGYDDEVYADAADALPTATGTQVVMVVDGAQGSLTVYVNGSLAGTQAGLTLDLAAIDDVNNWIGRSQFSVDPNFVGDVLDFRIFDGALSASQVALSHTLGANADL